MKMAHIVPKAHTHLISSNDYAMCLAQFVLSDDGYAADYLKWGENGWLIMDNGLAEEGRPVGPEKLLEAALRVLPSEIVLPDFLDPGANVKAAAQTLQHEGFMSFCQDRGIKLMYVPHGADLWEWLDNLKAVTTFDPMPDSIGISKFHDRIHPQSGVYGRGTLGCITRGLFPEMPIHYLGLSLPTAEIYKMAFARSCDTAIATMSAFHGLHFDTGGLLFRPETVMYQHDAVLNSTQLETARNNMRIMDEMSTYAASQQMLNG